MMKVELSKRLIKNIYENDFYSIGSFIDYKTQAEMCYKWIQLRTEEFDRIKLKNDRDRR